MAPALPVWITTKRILTYAWRERGLALRYAALPVGALFLLDLGGIAAGIDIEKNPWWQFGTGLLALLAYAPFTVTWFQSIVRGDIEARTRPVFVIAQLEKNVILVNIRIAAFIVVVSLLMVMILGGVMYGLSRVFPLSLEIFAVLIAPPVLFFWVLNLTCVSIAIAYAAAGEPIRLREAFRLTRPMAYRMTWIHIIVATLAFAIVGCAIGAIAGFDIPKGVAVSIVLSVINAIGGIVYLILATTLFGFVYRRLKDNAVDAS